MLSWTLVTALSAVGIIGTGLNPRAGILIQQFERGEKTFYLIGNVSTKDVKLRVVAFDETWRIGKPIGKVLAGPWDVAANSAVEIDVTKLRGGELLRFFLEDDTPLGVLHAPRDGLTAGLNGLGTGADGISLSLPDAPVKPGEAFVVTMKITAQAGAKVQFLPIRAVAGGLTAHELIPEKAESKTLTTRKGDAIEIDLGKPLKPADEHQVEFTFRVPNDPPPMVSFQLWIANHLGGGVTVARGLKVAR